MAADFRLDPNTHDIALGNSRMELVTEDLALVAQRLKIALLLRAREFFPNINEGVPYSQILTAKDNKDLVDAVLAERIRTTEGVESLTSYVSTINNRGLNVNFRVMVQGSEIGLAMEV